MLLHFKQRIPPEEYESFCEHGRARTDKFSLGAVSGQSIDPKSNSATRSKRPIADIVVAALEHCLPQAFGC